MENGSLTNEEIDETLAFIVRGLKDGSVKTNLAKELSNAIGKQTARDVAKLQAFVQCGIAMEIPGLGITEYSLSNSLPPTRKKKQLER